MSFLFGRARTRTVADLPKQAREHVLKLEGPQGPSKVAIISPHLDSRPNTDSKRPKSLPES